LKVTFTKKSSRRSSSGQEKRERVFSNIQKERERGHKKEISGVDEWTQKLSANRTRKKGFQSGISFWKWKISG
jgi:hypothetical protein